MIELGIIDAPEFAIVDAIRSPALDDWQPPTFVHFDSPIEYCT